MAGPAHRGGAMAEINVTPLVDVMLVLLIIFMVAAPMMQQGVDVQLPQVVATELPSDPDVLIVTVDRGGKIFLGRTRVTMADLDEKAKAILARKSRKEAFLRADKSVPYGTVVEVMAVMKRSGIERLGMVTEPVEEP